MSRRNRGRRPQAVIHATETGAKVPQDHLVKAEATGESTEIEFEGHHLVIDQDAIDDYGAFTLFRQGMPSDLLNLLVPDAAVRSELLESRRGEDGRLRLTSVITLTGEILRAAGAGN